MEGRRRPYQPKHSPSCSNWESMHPSMVLLIIHNGLAKTRRQIMQGMVAEKRSRGKPIQRWEKDITEVFGTMATASRGRRTGVDFARIFGQRRPEEDMLSEEELD